MGRCTAVRIASMAALAGCAGATVYATRRISRTAASLQNGLQRTPQGANESFNLEKQACNV
ncbi:MAG: hypothetical protein KDE65_02185, partial [Burkholderiaceae bacterium]|nr:hypothetical protein [Burkholderiaceae bacterium]